MKELSTLLADYGPRILIWISYVVSILVLLYVFIHWTKIKKLIRKKLISIFETILFMGFISHAYVYYIFWSICTCTSKKVKSIISKFNFLESIFWVIGLLMAIGLFVFIFLIKEINRSIYNFFMGEKIILKDAVVIRIIANKYMEPIDIYNSNFPVIELKEITDHYIEVIGLYQNYQVYVPHRKNNFFPGQKINLLCRKYFFDKKRLYFEKFV